MNTILKILSILTVVMLSFGLGFALISETTTLLKVTSITQNRFLNTTTIHSYEHSLIVNGLYSDIEVGHTYEITYRHSIPYAELLSIIEVTN
jgi:hypothetical protein